MPGAARVAEAGKAIGGAGRSVAFQMAEVRFLSVANVGAQAAVPQHAETPGAKTQ
jgi:hypothetical protein